MDFYNIFKNVKELVNKFNEMFTHGMRPQEQLRSDIILDQAQKIEKKISTASHNLLSWKNELKEIFEKSGKLENYYMLYFNGKTLGKVNKQNMNHYIKFISNSINLKKIKSSQQNNELNTARSKKEFIQDLVKRNKSAFSCFAKFVIKSKIIDDSLLNFMNVPSNQTYLFLIYMYNKVKVILEPSLILNCTLKTPWNKIKCKSC